MNPIDVTMVSGRKEPMPKVYCGTPTFIGVQKMNLNNQKVGGIPVVIGGDHSFFPDVVHALSDHRQGFIGVVHFYAHFDNGTTQIYIIICSDCIDAAFNTCGPANFNGLFAHALFDALYRLGPHLCLG